MTTSSFQSEFKTYLFTYQHDGSEWVIELKAKDEADARARCAKLAWARLDGELIAKIPQSLGWLAKVGVTFQNLAAFLRRPT
jgi:hypothetical protein